MVVAGTEARRRIERNILDLFQLETRCSDGLNWAQGSEGKKNQGFTQDVFDVDYV